MQKVHLVWLLWKRKQVYQRWELQRHMCWYPWWGQICLLFMYILISIIYVVNVYTYVNNTNESKLWLISSCFLTCDLSWRWWRWPGRGRARHPYWWVETQWIQWKHNLLIQISMVTILSSSTAIICGTLIGVIVAALIITLIVLTVKSK